MVGMETNGEQRDKFSVSAGVSCLALSPVSRGPTARIPASTRPES